MKLIAKITDKEILGTEGISNAPPRYTARAILKSTDGLYAIMFAKKFNFYSLAGGGVEENESVLQCLRREIAEETGCRCDTIEELGIVYENRYHADYTQYSYYYVVTTNCKDCRTDLTESEKENGTSVLWRSLEEITALIANPVHNTNQQKFLQARDVAALNYYFKTFDFED